MDDSKALGLLNALADGVDPHTGEELPLEHPCQHPDLVRAMSIAVQALERRMQEMQRKQSLPANVGKPWRADEEEQLVAAFEEGRSLRDIASTHQRTITSIRLRLEKLGKIQSVAG